MNFIDAVSVAGTQLTDDGYLIANALSVRSGIQHYHASEIGLPGNQMVPVYRPPEEVFSRDSVASFARVPVTMGHPTQMVTAESWKDVAIGEADSEVLRDGERLRIPITIRASDAIKAIQGGTRELSAGYTCDVEFSSGVTADGQHYDAVQRNIRANHIAVVAKGRAGPECRIGDDATARWGASPSIIDRKDTTMAEAVKTRTVLIDGLSVETTDAGAQALEKLQGDIATKDKAFTDAEAAHKAAIAAKDEELGKVKAELKLAQDALPKPGDLDRMAADRAALIAAVQKIAKDVKPDGLTDAELRKAAVVAKLGDEMVKDAADEEIGAMFKVVAASVGDNDKAVDPVRTAIAANDGNKVTSIDAVYAERDKALQSGWMGNQKKEA